MVVYKDLDRNIYKRASPHPDLRAELERLIGQRRGRDDAGQYVTHSYYPEKNVERDTVYT